MPANNFWGIVTEALPGYREDEHTWTARHFSPPWWLASAHLQTLAGKFLRGAPGGMLTTERIETPDGDFLDIDWMSETDPAAPLVVLVHGLEGHTKRGYMVQTYLALAARGMRAVGLNLRGCSGEANRAPASTTQARPRTSASSSGCSVSGSRPDR